MNPTLILGIGGGLALLLLIIGIVVTVTSEKSYAEERLGRYVDAEKDEQSKSKSKSTPLTDWLNKRVAKSSWGDTIARDLARADLKLKPGEYIALLFIVAVVFAIIFFLIGGEIAAVMGAVLGFFLPRFYVGRLKGKRLHKFNDQLGDMLNLMVNGLRAGYSTMQAMEAVSKELPAPICDEFRRLVQETQLGIPMEKALDNMLRRIPSDDLDLCVTAINVQREVGGNLAEILDTISYTIRERVRIKGEIRVLTTQVMYSGKFLSLLPILVIFALYLLNKEYMLEYLKNGLCGYLALGSSFLLIAVGYFVMNKIGNIEV
jgi:tight adherence protein B